MNLRLALASLLGGLVIAVFAPSVGAQGFHALHTLDGLDVWAVGDSGVVYRSTNSGADYFSFTVGSSALRGVAARGLVALLAAADGKVWRSTNGGGAWVAASLGGAPLHGIAFMTDSSACVVGAAGAIWTSGDAGASWTPRSSGTASTLRAVRFSGELEGWAVGDDGAAVHTLDGGETWMPVVIPTTNRLLGVDHSGSLVWVVGVKGTCLRSSDGGDSWQHVNLKLDARADVRVVRVAAPDTVWIGGGGGFLRRSVDGGATWTFLQHRMHGALSALALAGSRAYFCNSSNRAVFRTTNNGATWAMPPLMTMGQTFVRTLTFASDSLNVVRGSTMALSPVDESTIYAALGRRIYVTRDAGETWAVADSFPAGVGKCNAFVVSPKDTNLWVAAVGGGGSHPVADHILRRTAPSTWSVVRTQDFGEYGIPLEMHPDRPDTLYFGGDNAGLVRSTDFGATWTPWMTDTVFRSPCDIVVVPDSSEVVVVGDGVTSIGAGEYHRSLDGGQTFSLALSRAAVPSASEIPGLACSRLRNSTVIGTNWSQGGVQRLLHYGAAWDSVNNAGQAWGVDIARDDPNFAAFGRYNGVAIHTSYDGGATWSQISVPGIGSNYGLFARDREVVLAEQGLGIWKLRTTYGYTPPTSQFVSLSSPSGGQTWLGGSVRDIQWSQSNVAAVRLEYRLSDSDPWQFIAEAPGTAGRYAWTVPAVETYEAAVRVSDAWDGSPASASLSTFTILVPAAAAAPDSLAFGTIVKGGDSMLVVTIENPGSGPVTIGSVVTSNPAFTEGRSGFVIAAGGMDTVGVTFRPGAGVAFGATLDIASNAPGAPLLSIPLSGAGFGPAFAVEEDPLDFGSRDPGTASLDTLRILNPGTDSLVITDIVSDNPKFTPVRTSFMIPPGSSDTLGILYQPTVARLDTAILAITANDTVAAHAVTLYGHGRNTVAVSTVTPAAFALAQNQPNPFGGMTTIRYALPVAAEVTLEVFDLRGRRVATLVRAFQQPGSHTAAFGRGAASAGGGKLGTLSAGVYLYRLRAGAFESTRKMLYLR